MSDDVVNELRRVRRRYTSVSQKLDELRLRRGGLIIAAYMDGLSYSDISRESGISASNVHRIVSHWKDTQND